MGKVITTTEVESPETHVDVSIWQTDAGDYRYSTRVQFTSSEATSEEIMLEMCQMLRTADRVAHTEIDRRVRASFVSTMAYPEPEAAIRTDGHHHGEN